MDQSNSEEQELTTTPENIAFSTITTEPSSRTPKKDDVASFTERTTIEVTTSSPQNEDEVPTTTSKSGSSDPGTSSTTSASIPTPTEPSGESVDTGLEDGGKQTTSSPAEQGADGTTTQTSTIDIDEKLIETSKPTESSQSQIRELSTLPNAIESTITTTMKYLPDVEQSTLKASGDGAETTMGYLKTTSSTTDPVTSSISDISSISNESSTKPTEDDMDFTTTPQVHFNNETSETSIPTTTNNSDSVSDLDMKTENIQDPHYSSTPGPTTGRPNEVEFATTVNPSIPDSTTLTSKAVLSSIIPDTQIKYETTTTGSISTIFDESTTNPTEIKETDESVTSTARSSSTTMFPEDITPTTTKTLTSVTKSSNNESVEKLNEEIMEKLDRVDVGFNMSTTTESSSTDKYLEASIITATSPNPMETTTSSSLDIDTMGSTSDTSRAVSDIRTTESDLTTTPMTTLELSTMKDLISDEMNSTEAPKTMPPHFMLNITEIFPEPGSTPAEPNTSVTSSKTEVKTTSTKSSTFSPILKNLTELASTSPSSLTDPTDSTTQLSSDNKTSQDGVNSSTDLPTLPGLNDLEFVADYPEQFNHNDSSEIDSEFTTATPNTTTETTKQDLLKGVSPTSRKLSDGISTTGETIEEISTTSSPVPKLTEQSSYGTKTTTENLPTTTESSATFGESTPSTNSSDNPQTIVSFIVSVSATRTQTSKSKSITETHNVTYHHTVSLNHTEVTSTTVPTTTARSESDSSTTSPIDELVFDESISTPNPTLDATTMILDFGSETTTQRMDEKHTTSTPEETSIMGLLTDVDNATETSTMTTTDSQFMGTTSSPSMDANDDELVFDEMTSTAIPSNDTGIMVEVENITETSSSTTEALLPSSTVSSTPIKLEISTTSSPESAPENISMSVREEGVPSRNKTSRNFDLTLPTTTPSTETEISTEFVDPMVQENATEKMAPEISTISSSPALPFTTTEKVLPSSSRNFSDSDIGSDFADLFTSHSRSNPNSSLILDIVTRPPLPHNRTNSTSGESPTRIPTPSNKTEQEVSLIISTGRGNRSLTNPEAIHIAKELGSQISNVVNQLLLTSHKNFHLLPIFTECAHAKIPRRKSRVLNLEYEHLSHVVRIGAMG